VELSIVVQLLRYCFDVVTAVIVATLVDAVIVVIFVLLFPIQLILTLFIII
jgi:hypothetical protein